MSRDIRLAFLVGGRPSRDRIISRAERGNSFQKKNAQSGDEETLGVITLETKTPHGLMPGELVIIDGAEPEFFTGLYSKNHPSSKKRY